MLRPPCVVLAAGLLAGCGSSGTDEGSTVTLTHASWELALTQATVGGNAVEVSTEPVARLDLREQSGQLEAALTTPSFFVVQPATVLANQQEVRLLSDSSLGPFGRDATIVIPLDNGELATTFTVQSTVSVWYSDVPTDEPLVGAGSIAPDAHAPGISTWPFLTDGLLTAPPYLPWTGVGIWATEHCAPESFQASVTLRASGSDEPLAVDWRFGPETNADPPWPGEDSAQAQAIDWRPLLGKDLLVETGAVADLEGNAAQATSASFPILNLGEATSSQGFDSATVSDGAPSFLPAGDARCESGGCVQMGPTHYMIECQQPRQSVLGLLNTAGASRVNLRYRVLAKDVVPSAFPIVATFELRVAGHGELEERVVPDAASFVPDATLPDMALSTPWQTSSIELPAGADLAAFFVKMGGDWAACQAHPYASGESDLALIVDAISVE